MLSGVESIANDLVQLPGKTKKSKDVDNIT